MLEGFCGCRSRYMELIGPLIVHAQHRLVDRITENLGPPPPQAHFIAANRGLPVTATDYSQLQLHVAVDGTARAQPADPHSEPQPVNTFYSRMYVSIRREQFQTSA